MSIHIKPSHRGRLTALKKRTGKTEAELYKTGSPATRKMITFARSARKWKHADGGELLDDVNLYAYGAPIRDYGMEWNNKVDRLSAINNMIAQAGEQIGGMADKANGSVGGNFEEGSDIFNTNNGVKLDDTGMDNFMNFAACGGKLKACGGKLHCGGGKLFDYGGEFDNGITTYNVGGTHEENPYEGIQVGTDNQGTPNLVEEGEVRYQDYIFSNRLALNADIAKKYNIPTKYSNSTFAYVADKMGEESKEREFDPISKRGLEADMSKLRAAQEETKAIKQQEEQMQEINAIAEQLGVLPEDVINAMQMQQEDMQAQQQAEEVPNEEVPYALGGVLYGYKDLNLDNPQKTKSIFDDYQTTQNMYPKGGWLGLNPYNYTVADMTDWRYGDGISWVNPYGGEGYIATIPSGDNRHYKFASTAEKEEAMDAYKKFTEAMLTNPKLREWYFKQYDAATPKEAVKTKFYDDKGNLRQDWKEHFLALRNDNKIGPMHNMAARVGNRYYYTDPDSGQKVYVKPDNPSAYSTINRGFVADGVNGWNDFEIVDDDSYIGKTMEEKQAALLNGDNTPTYTSYESIGESPTTNVTTGNTNKPKSQAQGTFSKAMPEYSWMDFIPLYEFLTAKKPDYSQADALVDYTNRIPKPTYKPIGDYLQYHPFDRQYGANQLRGQLASTRRNNVNISAGNRAYANVANLAANMQAMLADAAMQRQADEANLNQRFQVGQFNRGTNQFNAEAFNRLELSRPYLEQMGLTARATRAQLHNALDNAYNASRSTNLNTWLNNMYARQREARDRQQLRWLADRGAFGNLGEDKSPYLEEDNLYTVIRDILNRKRNG